MGTTTVLFLLALLFSTTSYSQVVVTNKLDNPESNVIYNSNRSQVWIGGEWVVSEDKYVWKEGSWEDKKPGFIFMPGYKRSKWGLDLGFRNMERNRYETME